MASAEILKLGRRKGTSLPSKRVTFNDYPPPGRSRSHTDGRVRYESRRILYQHPVYRDKSTPADGRYITAFDEDVERHGGKTTALDNLPSRLRASKRQPAVDNKTRIEELTRENGELRHEMSVWKDKERSSVKLYAVLVDCLRKYRREIMQAEGQRRKIGDSAAWRERDLSGSRLYEILADSLQRYQGEVAQAEAAFLAFWNVQYPDF
ncbi:hypothetical protein MMC25_007331 [Agyrium rufum]|nr:hypothetical protein [Agyrium rufum]